MTIEQAAKKLGCDEAALTKLIERGLVATYADGELQPGALQELIRSDTKLSILSRARKEVSAEREAAECRQQYQKDNQVDYQ